MRLLTTDQNSEIRIYRSPLFHMERVIQHPHRCFQHITPIKVDSTHITGILYQGFKYINMYCRTHNVRVCLYIAYIACGSASLYIKTLYFFPTVLALSVAATVANIKLRYDAKTPQFALFGTRVICVFYSICLMK